jgi:hypothetical protein
MKQYFLKSQQKLSYQKIFRLLCSPQAHCRVYISPTLVPKPTVNSPFHTLPLNFLTPTSRSSKEFSLSFSDQSYCEYPICPHVHGIILCHLSHLSLFHCSKYYKRIHYESYFPGFFYGLTIMCSKITNNIFKRSCKVRIVFHLYYRSIFINYKASTKTGTR